MSDQLKEQIKVVAEARRILQEVKDSRDESLKRWEEDNNELLAHYMLGVKVVADTEAKLRELTLQAYAKTGNKAPAPGVGIREVTKLEYFTEYAYDWALEHKMALSLDKKAFERVAQVSSLDFVTITKEPQATISQDLVP